MAAIASISARTIWFRNGIVIENIHHLNLTYGFQLLAYRRLIDIHAFAFLLLPAHEIQVFALAMVELNGQCRPASNSLDFLRGEQAEEQIDIFEVEFGQYALDDLFIGQILADGLFVIRPKSTGSYELVGYLFTNIHSHKYNTF